LEEHRFALSRGEQGKPTFRAKEVPKLPLVGKGKVIDDV